ncbi:hypothetical protein PIB30_089926 [Stylosanthes scabra]|uniref:Uncharacterized protein n=1 Tax=Stylosanthes scabra TaxID=79078 RepID=A0ABU6RU41_9FABA|nr:hypothetical protein [Stylosanthes scabra]
MTAESRMQAHPLKGAKKNPPIEVELTGRHPTPKLEKQENRGTEEQNREVAVEQLMPRRGLSPLTTPRRDTHHTYQQHAPTPRRQHQSLGMRRDIHCPCSISTHA